MTWLLNDGSGSNNLSSVTTTTISVTAVNDAPTLSLGTTATSFTENGPSFVLSPTVTVADPDNTTWIGATVKIAGGTFVGDGDVLAADTTGTAITASYNSTTETLTLSGTDTLVDYQHVLQSVTFVTASENPTNYGSAQTRTVTWVANDGSGSFNLSTAQTETVSITAINGAPTLVNVATGASYTELGSVALASTLTVSDPDSLNLANATVTITGGTFPGDGDVLTFSTAGTSITASYNAGSETLTLTGSDSLVHYQQVLDSVAFSSTSHNPTNFGSNQTRTVTWLVNDGSGSFNLSGTATTTVSITAVNDAPTLTGTAPSVSFTENGAPVVLSPNVTVADTDSQTLSGATVQVGGGTFAGDGDVLGFSTAGTSITASYDSTTETLTLTGSDTLAHYQRCSTA